MSNITTCRDCGQGVSKDAKFCPHCGAESPARPLKPPPKPSNWLPPGAAEHNSAANEGPNLGVIVLVIGVLIFLIVLPFTTDIFKSDELLEYERVMSARPTEDQYQAALREIEEYGTQKSKENTYKPPLELVSWRWYFEHGYMHVTGQIKNVSNNKMSNVMVVATFTTASGDIVKTSDALIDYNPILPGQTSPFTTLTTQNPAATKCSISFKEFGGGTISYVNKKDRIKEVQELLNKHGYAAGTPDGIMGPNTKNAIRKFQKDNGLLADGAIDKHLLSALRSKQ